MKYTVTDLEIETIYARIKNIDINLQPDFQRGEIWSEKKKKKLIDTILRGWQIPPIHLIETKKFVDEVLDGQQRLATIRDFMDDIISIDGYINPVEDSLINLDGLRYSELDEENRRKFKKFSIRMIRLTEYKPDEPAELFYRLNQPATLTSAEQRNAFIGEARNQVKELVHLFEEEGASKDTIGFSNSRMAYDDIVSKFCYTLEAGTLRKKITSNDISDKFRSGDPFTFDTYEKVSETIIYFIRSVISSEDRFFSRLSLNKATLFSWWLFVYRNKNDIELQRLGDLIYQFEIVREYLKGKDSYMTDFDFLNKIESIQTQYPFFESMIMLFNQKASMGSTDATSIIMRDIILEVFFEMVESNEVKSTKLLKDLAKLYFEKQSLPQSIELISEMHFWGCII